MNWEAAEEALRRTRTLFEKIYEYSPDAMIVVDGIGEIECANVQAEDLFGLSRECMLGQPIEMLIPERFRNRHRTERLNYMRNPETRSMGVDLPLWGKRHDGSEFPADIMLKPVEIGRRRVVLAVVRDITERRRAEAHLQLLTREANHRVKNILSVVQAMAGQTKANSYEEFLSKFSERIQSLSASHGLLVRGAWKDVQLADLVRSQLGHFGDLIERRRIAASGPDLRITAAAAQTIGLALHELATNASKYGALSTNDGYVNIHWQAPGDIFKMIWIESKGPPVKPLRRHGFGTMVICEMVKQALDGEVRIDFERSGLAWRLTCPAANVLESHIGNP
jgi:PAS domain S-box-containing protein